MKNRTIRILSVGFLLALFSAGASAQNYGQQPRSGSTYDWRSGNQYYWNRDSSGQTNVRGFNFQNGSQWNTTIQRNGNMRGMDSGGNMWQYNNSTGFYQNFGTGRTCVGKGYARVCN